jgi:hypothetical protein
MRTVALLILMLVLAACAAVAPAPPKDTLVAPTLGRLPASALVVLAPADQHDAYLKPGDSLVLQALHRQLAGAGFRVAALEASNHDTVWRQEIDAAGGIYDPASGALRPAAYAQAVSSLARRICAEAGCTLLLRYRLATRPALLGGTTAEWDGQRRHQPVAGTGGDSWSFREGTMNALSVELQGLAADGTLVLRSFGGASLPFRADITGRKFELRTDLFDKDDEIADGVRLALVPLLNAR